MKTQTGSVTAEVHTFIESNKSCELNIAIKQAEKSLLMNRRSFSTRNSNGLRLNDDLSSDFTQSLRYSA